MGRSEQRTPDKCNLSSLSTYGKLEATFCAGGGCERMTSYAEVILGRARSRRYLRLADNPGVGLQHELGSVLYSSVFFDFPFS